MFGSRKVPDQQPDLGKADRSFVLAINGQRFEDISREEAKRLRQPRPACEVAPVDANGKPLGTAPMGA